MKIVIAPDSFKGYCSARTVASRMAAGVRAVAANARVVELPMADGGEGTGEVLAAALGGRWVEIDAAGPWGERRAASYLALNDGAAALIEVAAVVGLPLMPPGPLRPEIATTRGVGELLRAALEGGASNIWVALGGSATVDGGMGMATALGLRFRDARGRILNPGIDGDTVPRALARLRRCELRDRVPLEGIQITGLADVDSPLLGPQGAVAVFGPQKGVQPETAPLFERGLEQLAQVMEMRSRVDDRPGHAAKLAALASSSSHGQGLAQVPGAGAAGGLGYGLMAFLRARLVSGGDLVARLIGLGEACRDADLVLTGEGRLDAQSYMRKVVDVVCRESRGVPVLAVVGCVDPALPRPLPRLAAVEALNTQPSFGGARGEASEIETATAKLLRRCLG